MISRKAKLAGTGNFLEYRGTEPGEAFLSRDEAAQAVASLTAPSSELKVEAVDKNFGAMSLTQDSQNGNGKEKFLAAYMTPIFRVKLLPAFPDGTVLINSELYRWLHQKSGGAKTDLSPDHFFARSIIGRHTKTHLLLKELKITASLQRWER
jgi:hypothetical protein